MLGNITRREEYDLFAAWLAVSLSFAIIKLAPYGVLGPIHAVEPMVALTYLVIALLTAGIGLVLHELAHKFAAIKFGFWAEFRKNNFMLASGRRPCGTGRLCLCRARGNRDLQRQAGRQGTHPRREREDLGRRAGLPISCSVSRLPPSFSSAALSPLCQIPSFTRSASSGSRSMR